MKKKCLLPCRNPAMVITIKTLLVMKLTAVLLIATCLQVSAKGNAQNISISKRNTSLEKVFKEIHRKTGYQFFYQDELLQQAKKFDINVKNASIEQALELCFKDQPLNFTITEKTITIRRKEEVNVSNASPPLLIEVTGNVKDEKGNPLAGVTVSIVGEKGGVSTDEKGNFSIAVPENAILSFSYVGYKTVIEPVKGRTNIVIKLNPEQSSMNDIVVIGYGTQKKKDLTGSIVNLTPKDLTLGASASFDQMLQGKAAGVQVVQTSGAPGGNVNIVIRGISSITGGNSPLYVVDGYAIGTGGGGSDLTNFSSSSYSAGGMAGSSGANRINPLSDINPADIESIQILKDASATAIYGSRGANGVVIITTKRGRIGKPTISFDESSGLQELPKKLDMLTPRQYAEFNANGRDNAWVYAGGNASDPNSVRSPATMVKPAFRNPQSLPEKGTDWQDVIFRKALVQNYQLSANGGSKDVKYYVSGNYFDQDGIIIGSDFKKFGLRTNIDARLSNRLKLGSSFSGNYSYGDFARAEGHFGLGSIIIAALASDPTIPVYDSTGNPYSAEFSTPTGMPVTNPLLIAREYSDKRNVTTIFTNNYLEYEIMKGLVFKTSFGVNYSNSETRLWKSSKAPFYTSQNSVATAGMTEIKSLNYLNENTLNFHRVIKEKHEIDALAGFSVQKNSDDIFQAGASNFPTDQVTYLAAGSVTVGTNYKSEWSMASWFARMNYVFAGKYLFTATIRQDGSSRFGNNHKWGTFPSASIGYRLSDEAFMKNVRFISNLKFRASYGIAGNNLISNYASQGLLGITQNVANGSVISGITPSNMSNNNLTWEQSVQTNFGMDLSLFNNRINFTADVYRSLKKNLLLNVTLPAASGFYSSIENIGELENKGIEFSVYSENIQSKNFQWTTGINISSNHNKVLALNANTVSIFNSNYQITQVGSPISSFYLLHTTGVFQSLDEISKSPLQSPRVIPGDLKFEDVNGDGKITTADKKIVGSPWPDYVWGLDNRFTYKKLTLSISINASHGNDVYCATCETILNDAGVHNQLAIVANRWKSATDPGNGQIPMAVRSDYAYTLSSTSRYLFDGSFVKIRDINLSYLLPQKIMSRLRIQSFSLFADITNVYTFTKYPGYDPEGSISGDNIAASGIDYASYPNPRTFTIGARLSF